MAVTGWPRGRRAWLLVIFILSASLPAALPRTFGFCKDLCNSELGRGTCQEDGTCACMDGWTGQGCEKESPGLSIEIRRDGVYGYRFTSGLRVGAGPAVLDPQKKVLYVAAYDAATGRDAVLEVDPLNPSGHLVGSEASLTRGWGSLEGPRITSTTMVPEAFYCGSAGAFAATPADSSASSTCSAIEHPRAQGHSNASTSGGWYSVYRGLAMDLSGALTGVYAAHNMHNETSVKFRIARFEGSNCSGATWEDCALGTVPLATYDEPGILDAMASNEETGRVVYKLSPSDGVSRGRVGMLTPLLGAGNEFDVSADLLALKCPSCETKHDALKFETAMYAQTSDGANHVIFAGAALLDDINGYSYPALFKVPADSSAFLNGSGTEMYLDGSSAGVTIDSACEGMVDVNQGRFTTFTALAKRGAYGYAGTTGRDENCADCKHRSACVFMFPLNYAEGDMPSAAIVLNGGDGGLDEKDVWASAVEPDDNNANGGFLYFAVGDRSNAEFGRIVKVQIGGTDTASNCTSSCFKRVGTYKESTSFGGLAYIADLHGIVTMNRASDSVTISKFTTASVTDISPKFVHAGTSGTTITIMGSGFYLPDNDDPTNKAATIGCRFGHKSANDVDFQVEAWKPATYISSSEIRCEVPSAADAASSLTTFAEIQLTFDGYPTGNAAESTYFVRSLWTEYNMVVLYYDTPYFSAFDVGSAGAFESKVLYTGEDPDNVPVTLKIYGGPFIDSDGSSGAVARMFCRYNGNSSSDIAATYVSPAEVHCPVCVVSDASGTSRCGYHGTEGAAQYIPFAWLNEGIPKSDVDVALTMNGIDYHSSATQTDPLVLHVYGKPNGVSATHSREVALAYPGNAQPDGTMRLDKVMVNLIDVQGTSIENDMGIGNTRGFTIVAEVDSSASTGASAATLSVTDASATQMTTSGTATFDLNLSFVPRVGVYQIFFTGKDCTDGEPCTVLDVTSSIRFTVSPGEAAGLIVDPAGASGLYVTGEDYPEDAINVSATASVGLGFMIINTVDAGGNKLRTLDIEQHTITAAVVTTEIVNDVHEARTTGAVLGGTTVFYMENGEATVKDITLDSSAPSGQRLPYSHDVITYGDPSRGPHGTESKYLIQFSTVLQTSVAYAHAVVRMSIGDAVYLKVNSSAYSVISVDATQNPVKIPEVIHIGAYDGGNNWVGIHDTTLGNVTVSSPSSPAADIDGALTTGMDLATGTWTFASDENPLYAISPLLGEYSLRFSHEALQSVDQVIEITLGTNGYQLAANLPASFGPYRSAEVVTFDVFDVQVLDGGRNPFGVYDRFNTSFPGAVERRFEFSSSTLVLSGTTALRAVDGEVAVSGLSCIAPSVGTHKVIITEKEALVDGVSVGQSLLSGTFEIVIVDGLPVRLLVQGSPQTEYAVSLGANMVASEVPSYADDRLTPLDEFTVSSVDGGGNLVAPTTSFWINVTNELSSVNTSKTVVDVGAGSPSSTSSVQSSPVLLGTVLLSGTSQVQTYEQVTAHTVVNATHVKTYNTTRTYEITRTYYTDRTITASLNDTSREPYPYTTGDNTVLNREAVLVASTTYPRPGSLSRILSAGTVVFPGLHLSKPSVGNHELKFSSNDESIEPVTYILTVGTGRSNMLGLPSPCPLAADSSNYLICSTSDDCSCNQYLASTQVALDTLEVFVLDAGLNPVFENDTLPCTDCGDREVSLVSLESSLAVCRENMTAGTCECMGDDTSEQTISGNTCSQVKSFSSTSVDGMARFSGVYIMTPTLSSTYSSDGYKFTFSSPGLFDLSFGFIITEGVGYALSLVAPTVFPLPAVSSTTFRSDYVTRVSSSVASAEVRVLILDGGGNFVGATEPSGRIIYATCDTATLDQYPQAVGQGGSYYAVTCMTGYCASGQSEGVAKFQNLKLLRPPAGDHVITFSGSGLTVGTSYAIKVLVGDPVGLYVVNFNHTEFEALTSVELPPVEVAVVDAGNNLVGSANPITRVLTCVVTGPRHNFVTSENQDEEILLQGSGSTMFNELALGVPEVGEYNLTFSSMGLNDALLKINITYGPSTRLYIPVTFTTPDGVTFAPVARYNALKETNLSPLVVLILDGGLNYVQDASRNVTVTVDRGEIAYTVRDSSLGYVLLDDITLIRPSTGTYQFTFTTGSLTPVRMDITIDPGYPAVLDVCDANSFLERDGATSVCVEPVGYQADAQITLKSFQVRTLDAGRTFVESAWNSERRSVSLVLESFTDVDGQVHHALPTAENPLQPDLNGTQDLVDGRIGWCRNGMDINPVTTSRVDTDTGRTVYDTTYTDSSPAYCRETSYSGRAPDVHHNAGVKLVYPKAGIYMLKFTSECEFRYCGDAIYPNLEVDILQIQILPGRPATLRFVTEPPAENENDFRLEPQPIVELFDVADNLCSSTNTFMSAYLSPRAERLHGNVAPVIQGRSTFSSLRFNGERGIPYTLVFEVHSYDVKVEFSPFVLRPCETVKPNSYSDEKGRCHCLPGYTEDTVNGTGYVDDLDNYKVAGLELYKPVVFSEGNWLEALHPYGICVPCANGYFKPHPGSQPCTKCEDRFDTSRKDGVLSPNHTSTSNKTLPGALGRTSEEDCHCIVQLEPPFDTYFRNTSTHVKYKCEHCPPGGNCSGLGIEEIGALPGFYRTKRETTKFTECPNLEACLGGVLSECLAVNGSGHTGTLCASCLAEYAHPSVNGRFPPKCVECGNVGVNVAFFLLQWATIIIVVAATALMNVRLGSDAVCLIKTFISYLQTISLAQHLDLRWPDAPFGLMLFMEKISTINLQSFPTQCLTAWDYYSATGFYVTLPLALGTVGLIYFSVFQFLEDQRSGMSSNRRRRSAGDKGESEDVASEDESGLSPVIKSEALRTKSRVEAMDEASFGESWESHASDQVFMIGVILLWFMYPTLVQYLMGLLRCRQLDTGSDVFLIADMNIRCYDSTHSSWLFLFFLLFILYIVGIPLGLNTLVQLEGEAWGALGMRYRVGILFKGHDLTSAWWWETVIFVRKFILVTLVVLFSDSTRMGSYVIVWLLEAFFVLHLIVHPYANERQHRLESYGLLASVITFNCGILYLEGYGPYVELALSVVLFAVHISMWLLLIKSLVEEFAAEGRNALIARAKHDIQLEENIAEEFEKKRDTKEAEEKKKEEKVKLAAIAGAHLPFADDDLLEKVEKGTAAEIRADHVKLSNRLNDMRKTWAERRERNTQKRYLVDEAHRATEQSAVEKWRERRAKAASQSRTPATRDGQSLRETWREKMEKRERERALQRAGKSPEPALKGRRRGQ